MAKHCVFYAIQYDARDEKGWYTGNLGRFRDTPEGAMKKLEQAIDEAPTFFSVRLVEARVIEQKNAAIRVSAVK